MRNPGGICESCIESEPTNGEALDKDSERDDCSSPPCKRLKQAVLSFSALPSPLTACSNSSETSILQQRTSSIIENNVDASQQKTFVENPEVNGGLVTGAHSPLSVKDRTVEPQTPPDSAKVSQNMKMACGHSTSCSSSPEANSCVNDELMIVDQSPPEKVNSNDKVNNRSPPLKSAEKQKRKEDREKEKLQKQRLRFEKQKEKQEAKALKEKERLEAKRKRDQERQEKHAEKERKDKERMEKKEKEEKERQEKKEKRDEGKRKKEEEKMAKVEEKRKREAEKRSVEEEQERKKQKTQANFANFFIKSSTVTPKAVAENSRFKPFERKAGMSLAPVTRKQLSLDAKRTIDAGLQQQDILELYLRELKRRKLIPKHTKRKPATFAEQTEGSSDTVILDEAVTVDENSNSSIEIIEPRNLKESPSRDGLKYKLLQFHTNYRPAYYGTWRKKSRKISPRNPLQKDMELLDYEVDSDDEWEEEEPGESLSNSEGEDEADGEEDDDDDGFFVPHGYLSDDEGVEEDEDTEDGARGESDEKGTNGQNKQDQQLAKAKAWEAEMKRKCKPIKPVMVGCLWLEEASLNLTLKRFAACLLVDGPIHVESLPSSTSNEPSTVDLSSANNSGALYVPDEAMPVLIKILHGNPASIHKIMSLFRRQWTSKCLGRDITDEEVDENCPISKRQIEKKMQHIAIKERRTDRLRWYVHKHVLEKFGLDNLTVADGLNSLDSSVDASMFPVSPTTNTPSIKHFVRPLSPAFHKTTSPTVLKHNSKERRPGPPNLSLPLEVDSTSLSQNHCHPALQGSDIFSGENSHLPVKTEILINPNTCT